MWCMASIFAWMHSKSTIWLHEIYGFCCTYHPEHWLQFHFAFSIQFPIEHAPVREHHRSASESNIWNVIVTWAFDSELFFFSLSFSFDKTKFFWRISFWFRNLFENCKPLDFKICDFLEFTLSLYECTLHTEWLWSNLNILQFHGLSIIKVLLINWWSHFHCADGVKYSIAEHKTGVYWNLLAWFYWRTSMSIEIKWYNTLALWIKYLYRKHLFSNSVKIDGQFCKSAKKFKLNFSSNKCKIVKLEISSPKFQNKSFISNRNDRMQAKMIVFVLAKTIAGESMLNGTVNGNYTLCEKNNLWDHSSNFFPKSIHSDDKIMQWI